VNSEALRQLEHPTIPTIGNCSDKPLRVDSQPRSSSQAGTPGSLEADHAMSEQASVPEFKPNSPNQMLNKHLENFHKTKAKLNFGFRNVDNSQATQPATSTNPFAALEADNPKAEDAMDNLEEMREGWTFQGRRKHTPKIASLRQVLPQSTTLTPNHDITPGGRRKRTHSNAHCSYFTSLGISSPSGQDHARARIWPVLSREKNAQKEILIDALPSHGGGTHLRVSQSQVAELKLGSTLPASNSRKG